MREEYIKKSDLAFYITKDVIQDEALMIRNKKFNYNEMQIAEHFLELAIMGNINFVYDEIFYQVKQAKNE